VHITYSLTIALATEENWDPNHGDADQLKQWAKNVTKMYNLITGDFASKFKGSCDYVI
jgi:hypothetical protein